MFPFMEYRSTNKLIKYPFSESANLPQWLTNDFLLDLCIVTDTPDETYWLESLTYAPDYIDLTIAGKILRILRGDSVMEYSYRDDDIDIKLVIGTKNLRVSFGNFQMTSSQAAFEPSCIISRSKMVRNLNFLDGLVKLGEGYNMSITSAGNVLRFDCRPGAGMGFLPCEPKSYDYIRKINGEPVDTNLFIKGSVCIDIYKYPEINLFGIHDKCKPCGHDCEERMDAVSAKIVEMQDEIDDLDQRITNLGG